MGCFFGTSWRIQFFRFIKSQKMCGEQKAGDSYRVAVDSNRMWAEEDTVVEEGVAVAVEAA